MSAARGSSGKAAGGLAPAALRGLLDATPAAIGCFDHALRAVYTNTAFTMTTGVQAGRVLEDEALAAEVRAMLRGSRAPRRVRVGGERRMPVSGTLFELDGGLIGMVLDAGAHEALAALAEEQSALRRVATLVASAPEPEAVFQAVAEEARASAARSLRGHGPLRGGPGRHGRAVGGRGPRRLRRRHLGAAPG